MGGYDRMGGERGNLCVEGAITFPVLILLLFGTVDIGALVERYFTLSRIVYEGARYGASLSGLGPGSFERRCALGKTPGNSSFPCSTVIDSYHARLQEKVTLLLSSQGFSGIERSRIRTEFVGKVNSGSSIQPETNLVRVTIEIPVPLITSLFAQELTLSSSSTAPYLYRLQ
jgi:hypothetical protein